MKKAKSLPILTLAVVLAGTTCAQQFNFTTLAGSLGGPGYSDGAGNAARFSSPTGVAVDNAGSILVADNPNHTIRKIMPSGIVSTLAGLAGVSGSVDGMGGAARFCYPYGVAVDSVGNIYVTETYNSTVRKITPEGVVSTLAGLAGNAGNIDGTSTVARFDAPQGVGVDTAGNIYVGDTYNFTIRRITSDGVVSTLAGLASIPGGEDGVASDAWFNHPPAIALDRAGTVYVADGSTVRKITPGGVVSTLAGLANTPGSVDGAGSAARFYYAQGVAVDSMSNVYVADTYNSTIRKITPEGVVSTLAGLAGTRASADGTGETVRFENQVA